VEPDRFDDVAFRMLEEPEPPRRPRLRRWTLTALSAVLAAGSFATGASALSGDDAAPTAKAAGEVGKTVYPHDWRDCDRPPAAALRH
jgi:hypothetical protein